MGARSSKKKPRDELTFIPEHEQLYEGGPGTEELFDKCDKNPGHLSFIPVHKFNVDVHLPPQYRTAEMKKCMKILCDLTVKMMVKYTSSKRPETYPNGRTPYPDSKFKESTRRVRIGTGFVMHDATVVEGKTCPCPLCQKSAEPKKSFIKVTVRTASHVVFDYSEAAHTVCEMFYDNEERYNVKRLYGVGNKYETLFAFNVASRCSDDVFHLPCVTHDLDLVKHLVKRVDSSIKIPQIPLIVSHPHGRSKHITIGSYCHVCTQAPTNYERAIRFKPGMKCRLPENTDTLTIKPFSQFLHSKKPCEPGVKYTLQKGMSVLLPKDTEFLLCQKQDRGWVTFPDGTQFTRGNGEKYFLLPDVEFFLPHCAKHFFKDGYIPCYMTYDTNTCPGSSGAQLLGNSKLGSSEYLYLIPPHSGALSGKVNKSGLYKSFIFFTRQSSEEMYPKGSVRP